MDEKRYRWLREEVENWVACGIVTRGQAEAICACYAAREKRAGVRLGELASWIGAILIGLGVILLLAYNWDELSRPSRLGVAAGLLLVSQAGAYASAARERAGRYREAWSVLQALLVGAALALMGQTYHISARFDRLLLVWMTLVLPLAYLLNAVLPAVVYAVVGCFWGFAVRDSALLWLGWLLAAAALPLGRRWAADTARLRALLWSGGLYLLLFQWAWLRMFDGKPQEWLAWALLALLFALRRRLGKPVERALFGWLASLDALLVFLATCLPHSGLFAMQILAVYAVGMAAWGRWLEAEADGALLRPLSSLGMALSLALCFGLSFRQQWEAWLWRQLAERDFLAVAAGCLCLTAFALWRSNRGRRLDAMEWMHASMGLLLLCLLVLQAPLAAVVAVNAYLFAWGALLVKRGADACRGVWLNGGMGILSLLALARFFDTDMSYLTRGVIFIALGAAFIGANAWLARRKEAKRDEG